MKLPPHICKKNLNTRCLLGALLIALSWGASLEAQTVTLYQQDFQSPSGPHGDVYFNVASPYDGITDGTGTGATSELTPSL
jgi:hypothetical protein